jgi:hypothetical protein
MAGGVVRAEIVSRCGRIDAHRLTEIIGMGRPEPERGTAVNARDLHEGSSLRRVTWSPLNTPAGRGCPDLMTASVDGLKDHLPLLSMWLNTW